MVPLLVGATTQTRIVERTRDGVGVGAVELDLDPEGLVWIADHTIQLVLTGGLRPCELHQSLVEFIVVAERPLSIGDLGALQGKELIPKRL